MRARLSNTDRNALFAKLLQLNVTPLHMAQQLQISVRAISDWRRGKYTIPYESFKKLMDMADMRPEELAVSNLDNWWYTHGAGEKGARVRMARHGPLGTPESRHKGGTNSYVARKDARGDIFTRTAIRFPDVDERLAEFFGIMIGDGNITKYQASIALSSLVDVEYSVYVMRLLFELFGLSPSVVKKGSSNCLVITASSVELSEFLVNKGLPLGDKLRGNLNIPGWILADRNLSMACVRGILDTDGCIFQECHIIRGKQYRYPRLSFVSMSPTLRTSLGEVPKWLKGTVC
jgi:hypothetical protein